MKCNSLGLKCRFSAQCEDRKLALIRACASVEIRDSIDDMASITIRQLEESTKARLRVRAASHGRSMEEEAREILKTALTTERRGPSNLAESIRRRFAALGGVELPESSRHHR